jgi:hypothetical protein
MEARLKASSITIFTRFRAGSRVGVLWVGPEINNCNKGGKHHWLLMDTPASWGACVDLLDSTCPFKMKLRWEVKHIMHLSTRVLPRN